MKSYVVHYWATKGYMLGGVKESWSSRWGTREDAENYLRNVTEVNASADNEVLGQILETDKYPEIFPHCKGHPSQVIGGVCFGCKKMLTVDDAKAFKEA